MCLYYEASWDGASCVPERREAGRFDKARNCFARFIIEGYYRRARFQSILAALHCILPVPSFRGGVRWGRGGAGNGRRYYEDRDAGASLDGRSVPCCVNSWEYKPLLL